MIELQAVTKVYRMGDIEVDALRGVGLKIKLGEFVAIMGPSGSGKSTLAHIIGCLDVPTSGTYALDGVEVSRCSDDELAKIRNEKIGFVFQAFNLIPRTTALTNVEMPLVYAGEHNQRKERAMAALQQVGVADRASHEPTEMSGGQQQRVAIARALINNPAIILADEPTGNLDTQSSHDIMTLFQKLHSDGRTIVYITHEVEIAAYAARQIHLRDGEIVQDEVSK